MMSALARVGWPLSKRDVGHRDRDAAGRVSGRDRKPRQQYGRHSHERPRERRADELGPPQHDGDPDQRDHAGEDEDGEQDGDQFHHDRRIAQEEPGPRPRGQAAGDAEPPPQRGPKFQPAANASRFVPSDRITGAHPTGRSLPPSQADFVRFGLNRETDPRAQSARLSRRVQEWHDEQLNLYDRGPS